MYLNYKVMSTSIFNMHDLFLNVLFNNVVLVSGAISLTECILPYM
jgi:hypothetical protein